MSTSYIMDDYLHSQSKNEEASLIDRRLDDGDGFPRFLVVSSANSSATVWTNWTVSSLVKLSSAK